MDQFIETIETNPPNCYPTPRMSNSQQTKIKQQTNLGGLTLGLPPLTYNRDGGSTLALMLDKNTSKSVWFLFHLCGPNNHLGIMLPLF